MRLDDLAASEHRIFALSPIPKDRLITLATDYFWPRAEGSIEELCVDFLRESNALFQEFSQKCHDVRFLKKLYEAITLQHPWLKEECDRQLEESFMIAQM